MIWSRRFALVVALVTFDSLMPCEGVSWESDVHLGLTQWLAVRAGFSTAHAEIIARGDESLDEGDYFPAPSVVAWHIIVNGDVGASRAVQKNHFSSYAPIPNPPEQRTVQPDSPAAREQSEREAVAIPDTKPVERSLSDFGQSLHPLQDSWSHAGIPDIPFGLRPTLSWGHPELRGGWASHDADITCKHVDEAVTMANTTYNFLLKYLDANPRLRAQGSQPWQVLEPKVREFAKACSKQEKAAWFLENSTVPLGEHPDLVQDLSIRGEPEGEERLRPARKMTEEARRELQRAIASVPHDAHEIAHLFLKAWFVNASLGAAVEMVSVDHIRKQLARFELDINETLDWIYKFLTMWLVADHGAVNEWGHGVPIAAGYSRLPSTIAAARAAGLRVRHYESLAQVSGVRDGDPPFMMQRMNVSPGVDLNDAYGVVVPFRDLPHDAAVIVVAETNNGWRVVRLYWIVL